MKLGLDLHGVISDLPEVFKFMCESIIKNNGEVHIITGGSRMKALKEMELLGIHASIHYTHFFSLLDYHIENETTVTGWNEKYKNPEFSDKDWDATKAEYCRNHGINLHIDDSMIYNEYFSTPFARLYTHTGTPKTNKPERHLD